MARLTSFVVLVMPALALAGMRGRPSPGAAVQAVQTQLQAAGDQDSAAHDKAGCFCQTNLADKQQTVENMQEQITGMSHDIVEKSAKITQLDLEVKQHQSEFEESSSSLATAEALRKKEAEKYADDEATHTSSIDSLQQALAALKNPHGSRDAALIAIREVTRRSNNADILQAQRVLKNGASQPAGAITGVMQRMLNSFNTNLQGMRDDEIEAKSRHDGLVSAKSSEIAAQKRFVLTKNQRLASTKVAVNFKKDIQGHSSKVLDANIQLLNTLKQICQRNDDSFEARQKSLQAELTALAGAQVDLAGAQLLSVSSTSRGDGSEAICSIASEFREKEWRAKARSACEKAKAGTNPDAADVVESLESDVKEAQNNAKKKQEDCTEEVHGSQMAASVAESQESAEANVVGDTQRDSEEQMAALTAQSDGAAKAKTDFAQITSTEKEAFQALRVATSRGKEVLNDAANREAGRAAAGKIAEATGEGEKLMATVDEFVAANDADAQQLASQLDAVQMVARKALIPLRLQKADSEEAGIAITEEHDSRAHARKPTCNSGALAAEVSRLSGYRAKLGKAAEGLAWESLR